MTPEHTDMTGAARLREALERLLRSLDTSETLRRRHDCREDGVPMVVVRMTRDDVQEIEIAERKAREVLAAVPEAPEPVYEWRAVFPNGDGSYSVQPLAKAPRPGTRMLVEGHNRGWVERRHAVAWERVEEGTER